MRYVTDSSVVSSMHRKSANTLSRCHSIAQASSSRSTEGAAAYQLRIFYKLLAQLSSAYRILNTDMEMQSAEQPSPAKKSSGEVTTPLFNGGPDNEAHVQEERKQKRTCDYRLYRKKGTAEAEMTAMDSLRAFRQRATLVGWTQYHESFGAVKKAFWGLITVMSLAFLLVHTYFLISRFALFDTNIEHELVAEKRMDFPAVTICNHNMMAVSPKSNRTPTVEDNIRELDKYVDYLSLNDSKLGHQKSDMLVWASFDNQRLSIDEDFHLVLNGYYGNCFTFNLHNRRCTRRALPGYGLQLLINAETYKYNNFEHHNPPDWKGAIVKVHPHDTEAIIEEGGVITATNTLSRLAVKKTLLTRMNGMYGTCLTSDEPHVQTYYKHSYTKEHCDNTCLQREIISQCCCYIKTIPRDMSEFNDTWESCYKRFVRPCKDEELCWKRVWERYDNGDLACSGCIDTCSEMVYDVTTVAAKWPTDEYMNGILKTELNKNKKLLDELVEYDVINNRSITSEAIRNNFLKVQIYYDSMTTTYIQQVPAVGVAEFCSEMSSAIGFWTGWTMWTVFQFSEFISDVLVIFCRTRCGSKKEKSSESLDS